MKRWTVALSEEMALRPPRIFACQSGIVRGGRLDFGWGTAAFDGDPPPDGTKITTSAFRRSDSGGASDFLSSMLDDAARETGRPTGAFVAEAWVAADLEAEREAATEREAERARRDAAARRASEEASERRQALEADLPFAWDASVRTVLSGLTARSNGDGMNARSVIHVRVLESIREGRLTREAGQFLCTPESGRGFDTSERASDDYPACPTCPKCLDRAFRIIPDRAPAPEEAEPTGLSF